MDPSKIGQIVTSTLNCRHPTQPVKLEYFHKLPEVASTEREAALKTGAASLSFTIYQWPFTMKNVNSPVRQLTSSPAISDEPKIFFTFLWNLWNPFTGSVHIRIHWPVTRLTPFDLQINRLGGFWHLLGSRCCWFLCRQPPLRYRMYSLAVRISRFNVGWKGINACDTLGSLISDAQQGGLG